MFIAVVGNFISSYQLFEKYAQTIFLFTSVSKLLILSVVTTSSVPPKSGKAEWYIPEVGAISLLESIFAVVIK